MTPDRSGRRRRQPLLFGTSQGRGPPRRPGHPRPRVCRPSCTSALRGPAPGSGLHRAAAGRESRLCQPREVWPRLSPTAARWGPHTFSAAGGAVNSGRGASAPEQRGACRRPGPRGRGLPEDRAPRDTAPRDTAEAWRAAGRGAQRRSSRVGQRCHPFSPQKQEGRQRERGGPCPRGPLHAATRCRRRHAAAAPPGGERAPGPRGPCGSAGWTKGAASRRRPAPVVTWNTGANGAAARKHANTQSRRKGRRPPSNFTQHMAHAVFATRQKRKAFETVSVLYSLPLSLPGRRRGRWPDTPVAARIQVPMTGSVV